MLQPLWCAGSAVLVLAALLLAWGPARELRRAWGLLRPLVPEPEGLEAPLLALPDRRLSDAEREQLARDGVLLVRQAVPDAALLRRLEPLLRQHQQFNKNDFPTTWKYNGAIRALLRDGPLSQLLYSFWQVPEDGKACVTLNEAPIWGTKGVEEFNFGGFHQDDPGNFSMVTLWLAVTQAPHGLEFLLGSHSFGADVMKACNRSAELGPRGAVILDAKCALEFVQGLDQHNGRPSRWYPDLQPGDALMFLGRVFHRSVAWPRPRLAVALRASPYRQCSCKEERKQYRIILSQRRGEDPFFGCAQEQLLPRPTHLWPGLPDALPLPSRPGAWGGSPRAWALGALRRAAAAAESAAFAL